VELARKNNMPHIGVDKYKENPMERLFHLLYFKVLMLARDGLKGRTHNEISFNKYSTKVVRTYRIEEKDNRGEKDQAET
jgi:hypothetical protein